MNKNEIIDAMSKLGYKYTDDGNVLNNKFRNSKFSYCSQTSS